MDDYIPMQIDEEFQKWIWFSTYSKLFLKLLHFLLSPCRLYASNLTQRVRLIPETANAVQTSSYISLDTRFILEIHNTPT